MVPPKRDLYVEERQKVLKFTEKSSLHLVAINSLIIYALLNKHKYKQAWLYLTFLSMLDITFCSLANVL